MIRGSAKFVFVACLSGIMISCGDDVTRRDRTIYVDKNGNQVASGDQQAQSTSTDTSTTPTSGANKTAAVITSPPGTTLQGAVTAVSALGLVEGWAVNKSDLTKTANILLYVDGDASTGTEVGNVPASASGFDNNFDGNHRFEFQLPTQYRDGTKHTLFIKMSEGSQEGAITPTAKEYTAYAPTAAGQQYYANNLKSALQSNCGGCHAASEVNYDNHFKLLLDASPADGGTATTNRLITKASGGLNHTGGNRCGNINAGICAQLQTWWNTEF